MQSSDGQLFAALVGDTLYFYNTSTLVTPNVARPKARKFPAPIDDFAWNPSTADDADKQDRSACTRMCNQLSHCASESVLARCPVPVRLLWLSMAVAMTEPQSNRW